METKNLIERTIEKMDRSQKKKKEIVDYMETHTPYLLGSVFKKWRIKDCCNVLIFHDYLNWEQKLHTANFCKYDKFCLACATRRSIRMIQKFEKWIQQYGLDKKNWYHITLTVRHNKYQSLQTVLNKLCKAKDKLAKSYRNSKRNAQKTKSFMHHFEWIIASIEVTYNERSWWHPHIHMLACTDDTLQIDKLEYSMWNRELQAEWLKITWDSNQISMRKIDVDHDHFDRKWIWEVFKYAVKFSTLDVPHLVELIDLQHQKKYHFFSTYWIFRWWKLDKIENVADKEFIERSMVYLDDEYEDVKNIEKQNSYENENFIDLQAILDEIN